MRMDKARELGEELREVLSGRGAQFLDSILPLALFLIGNAVAGVEAGLWAALVSASGFALYRIYRKESLVYALAGLGGVILAALFVRLSGSEAGFFLPGFITGAITIIVCVISVLFNRPLVAWTSHITRRWPRGWYWHPRVLPAYNEVTIFWAVAFAIRLALEYWLYIQDAWNSLGAVRVLLDWPFTIVLLVITYLYGLWRLGQLNGPSVEEFKTDAPPPWEGQKRGF